MRLPMGCSALMPSATLEGDTSPPAAGAEWRPRGAAAPRRVAHIAEESAQPLPSGSTWHRYGGAELEQLLEQTPPIDVGWLLKLALGEVMPDGKGVVPAWQQVPPEAVVSLDDLHHSTMRGFLPVLVLSYGWASRSHPDPTGALLQSFVPVLRMLVESCSKGLDHDHPETGKLCKWAIVWDFMSLPQRSYTSGYVPDECGPDGKVTKSNDYRTPYEKVRFGKGLKAVNVWYGAPHVTTPCGRRSRVPPRRRTDCRWGRTRSPTPRCRPNSPRSRRGRCPSSRGSRSKATS